MALSYNNNYKKVIIEYILRISGNYKLREVNNTYVIEINFIELNLDKTQTYGFLV